MMDSFRNTSSLSNVKKHAQFSWGSVIIKTRRLWSGALGALGLQKVRGVKTTFARGERNYAESRLTPQQMMHQLQSLATPSQLMSHYLGCEGCFPVRIYWTIMAREAAPPTRLFKNIMPISPFSRCLTSLSLFLDAISGSFLPLPPPAVCHVVLACACVVKSGSSLINDSHVWDFRCLFFIRSAVSGLRHTKVRKCGGNWN